MHNYFDNFEMFHNSGFIRVFFNSEHIYLIVVPSFPPFPISGVQSFSLSTSKLCALYAHNHLEENIHYT